MLRQESGQLRRTSSFPQDPTELHEQCASCCDALENGSYVADACNSCGCRVCSWCLRHILDSNEGSCPSCRAPYGFGGASNADYGGMRGVPASRDRADIPLRRTHSASAPSPGYMPMDPLSLSLSPAMGPSVPHSHGGAGSAGGHSGLTLSLKSPGGVGGGFGMAGPPSASGPGSVERIRAVDRRSLQHLRVIQRHLVYVIGLSPNVASEEILRSGRYFGQYGRVAKVVINHHHGVGPEDPRHGSASAYITFQYAEDAWSAIKAVDGFALEGRHVRASFGTTKYCNSFLRNLPCNNPDCLYLHELGDEEDRFTKEQIQAGLARHGSSFAFREEFRGAGRFGSPSGTGEYLPDPVLPPPVASPRRNSESDAGGAFSSSGITPGGAGAFSTSLGSVGGFTTSLGGGGPATGAFTTTLASVGTGAAAGGNGVGAGTGIGAAVSGASASGGGSGGGGGGAGGGSVGGSAPFNGSSGSNGGSTGAYGSNGGDGGASSYPGPSANGTNAAAGGYSSSGGGGGGGAYASNGGGGGNAFVSSGGGGGGGSAYMSSSSGSGGYASNGMSGGGGGYGPGGGGGGSSSPYGFNGGGVNRGPPLQPQRRNQAHMHMPGPNAPPRGFGPSRGPMGPTRSPQQPFYPNQGPHSRPQPMSSGSQMYPQSGSPGLGPRYHGGGGMGGGGGMAGRAPSVRRDWQQRPVRQPSPMGVGQGPPQRLTRERSDPGASWQGGGGGGGGWAPPSNHNGGHPHGTLPRANSASSYAMEEARRNGGFFVGGGGYGVDGGGGGYDDQPRVHHSRSFDEPRHLGYEYRGHRPNAYSVDDQRLGAMGSGGIGGGSGGGGSSMEDPAAGGSGGGLGHRDGGEMAQHYHGDAGDLFVTRADAAGGGRAMSVDEHRRTTMAGGRLHHSGSPDIGGMLMGGGGPESGGGGGQRGMGMAGGGGAMPEFASMGPPRGDGGGVDRDGNGGSGGGRDGNGGGVGYAPPPIEPTATSIRPRSGSLGAVPQARSPVVAGLGLGMGLDDGMWSPGGATFAGAVPPPGIRSRMASLSLSDSAAPALSNGAGGGPGSADGPPPREGHPAGSAAPVPSYSGGNSGNGGGGGPIHFLAEDGAEPSAPPQWEVERGGSAPPQYGAHQQQQHGYQEQRQTSPSPPMENQRQQQRSPAQEEPSMSLRQMQGQQQQQFQQDESQQPLDLRPRSPSGGQLQGGGSGGGDGRAISPNSDADSSMGGLPPPHPRNSRQFSPSGAGGGGPGGVGGNVPRRSSAPPELPSGVGGGAYGPQAQAGRPPPPPGYVTSRSASPGAMVTPPQGPYYAGVAAGTQPHPAALTPPLQEQYGRDPTFSPMQQQRAAPQQPPQPPLKATMRYDYTPPVGHSPVAAGMREPPHHAAMPQSQFRHQQDYLSPSLVGSQGPEMDGSGGASGRASPRSRDDGMGGAVAELRRSPRLQEQPYPPHVHGGQQQQQLPPPEQQQYRHQPPPQQQPVAPPQHEQHFVSQYSMPMQTQLPPQHQQQHQEQQQQHFMYPPAGPSDKLAPLAAGHLPMAPVSTAQESGSGGDGAGGKHGQWVPAMPAGGASAASTGPGAVDIRSPDSWDSTSGSSPVTLGSSSSDGGGNGGGSRKDGGGGANAGAKALGHERIDDEQVKGVAGGPVHEGAPPADHALHLELPAEAHGRGGGAGGGGGDAMIFGGQFSFGSWSHQAAQEQAS